MVDWLISQIKLDVVVSAPLPFGAIFFLGIIAGWYWGRSRDADLMKFWRESSNEYKDKLHGASPTDAALKIETLERRTAELEAREARKWPRLTADQISQLKRSLPLILAGKDFCLGSEPFDDCQG